MDWLESLLTLIQIYWNKLDESVQFFTAVFGVIAFSFGVYQWIRGKDFISIANKILREIKILSTLTSNGRAQDIPNTSSSDGAIRGSGDFAFAGTHVRLPVDEAWAQLNLTDDIALENFERLYPNKYKIEINESKAFNAWKKVDSTSMRQVDKFIREYSGLASGALDDEAHRHQRRAQGIFKYTIIFFVAGFIAIVIGITLMLIKISADVDLFSWNLFSYNAIYIGFIILMSVIFIVGAVNVEDLGPWAMIAAMLGILATLDHFEIVLVSHTISFACFVFPFIWISGGLLFESGNIRAGIPAAITIVILILALFIDLPFSWTQIVILILISSGISTILFSKSLALALSTPSWR